MISYRAVFSKEFKKEFRKLSSVDQKLVVKKVRLLENNPFYPSLRTKKLEGGAEYYESSVNMDIRLLWQFEANKIIFLVDIGHHDVLKKY